MARPKTEDGFVMIAIDLFPAIMAAGLSGYAQIVLAEVLMQTYGPRKRESVHLWAVELSELTGLEYNNCRRAIRELVQAGVLARDEGADAYRFVKDYESWRPSPGPLSGRLGGGLLRWIRGSIGRLGTPGRIKGTSRRQQSTQTVSEGVQDSLPGLSGPAGKQSAQTAPDSLPRLCLGDQKQSTQTVAAGGATKERACVRELVLSSSPSLEERKEDVKTRENGDVIPDGVATKPGPEHVAVGNLAIEMACDLSWGTWVNQQALIGYPAAWIKQAIETAAGNGKLAKPYVAEILRGYQKAGGPPAAGSVAPARSTPPAARTAPPPVVRADPESTHPRHRTPEQHRAVAAKWGVSLDEYFRRIGIPLEMTA